MDELLSKVKANLILEHTADDALAFKVTSPPLFLTPELPAHPGGHYKENPMPATTEQAVIMLSSHFYESRDGSTGGFLRITPERRSRCGTPSICCSAWTGGGRYELLGKMNGFADIVKTKQGKDSEGFTNSEDEVLASIRVYTGKVGTAVSVGRTSAAFSEATDLFRFRRILG